MGVTRMKLKNMTEEEKARFSGAIKCSFCDSVIRQDETEYKKSGDREMCENCFFGRIGVVLVDCPINYETRNV